MSSSCSAVQQRSVETSRTLIISDPQHCSVSATLSLGRPKKLFISSSRGRNATKSAATATFQVASPQQQHSSAQQAERTKIIPVT
ncbi:unnamed protein product, partial [Gongylonema pulchrum]|uniref:Uncharacterized protein n=1 Tax=Gongylonema pulchrum TaxID=637853 RepID=A0A183EXB3_9BILA